MNPFLTYVLIFLAVLIVMSIPSTFVVVAVVMNSAHISRTEENAYHPF